MNVATSIIMNTLSTQGEKSQRSITYVNEQASDYEMREFADALNDLTTNDLDGISRVSTKDIMNAEEKLSRNLTVKHNNVELTTINPADLPTKTGDGQYLININYDGETDTAPFIRNVMTRTGEVYICCIAGASSNAWLLDLRKNNSPTGNITIYIPADDTYQSAEYHIVVGE